MNVASFPVPSTRRSCGTQGSTRAPSRRTASPARAAVSCAACTSAAETARPNSCAARTARSSTSSWICAPPRRPTATGKASNSATTSRFPLRPGGLRHGFQALTDPADVSYRIDRPHDPSEDVSIVFDDPELAIPWPLPVTVMSKRDGWHRRWLPRRNCSLAANDAAGFASCHGPHRRSPLQGF